LGDFHYAASLLGASSSHTAYQDFIPRSLPHVAPASYLNEISLFLPVRDFASRILPGAVTPGVSGAGSMPPLAPFSIASWSWYSPWCHSRHPSTGMLSPQNAASARSADGCLCLARRRLSDRSLLSSLPPRMRNLRGPSTFPDPLLCGVNPRLNSTKRHNRTLTASQFATAHSHLACGRMSVVPRWLTRKRSARRCQLRARNDCERLRQGAPTEFLLNHLVGKG
jgi:hypothetical protein